MRAFIIFPFFFVVSLGYAQNPKNFFSANHKDVIDFVNSMISTTNNKYILIKSDPAENPDYFLYSDGLDSLHFQFRIGWWQKPDGFPAPPDTLSHYLVHNITGKFKVLFPIWKKYYEPDANAAKIQGTNDTDPVIASATITDNNGVNNATFAPNFHLKNGYWRIFSNNFQAIYNLAKQSGE